MKNEIGLGIVNVESDKFAAGESRKSFPLQNKISIGGDRLAGCKIENMRDGRISSCGNREAHAVGNLRGRVSQFHRVGPAGICDIQIRPAGERFLKIAEDQVSGVLRWG